VLRVFQKQVFPENGKIRLSRKHFPECICPPKDIGLNLTQPLQFFSGKMSLGKYVRKKCLWEKLIWKKLIAPTFGDEVFQKI